MLKLQHFKHVNLLVTPWVYISQNSSDAGQTCLAQNFHQTRIYFTGAELKWVAQEVRENPFCLCVHVSVLLKES